MNVQLSLGFRCSAGTWSISRSPISSLTLGKEKGWSLRGDLGVFLLVGSNE